MHRQEATDRAIHLLAERVNAANPLKIPGAESRQVGRCVKAGSNLSAISASRNIRFHTGQFKFFFFSPPPDFVAIAGIEEKAWKGVKSERT